MRRNTLWKGLGLIGCFWGTVGLLSGCGSVLKEQKTETTTSMTVTAPAGKKADRPDGRYYDFDDIQIPSELKLDAKKSRVFQSPNAISGVLVFNGYVEVNSLINFFKDAMAKDNWQAKGSFKLHPKTVLLFEKKNKRSVFIIEETYFNTRVEIWNLSATDG
jgi:hypothetical protein